MEMKIGEGIRGGEILSYLGYNYRPDKIKFWKSTKQTWQCTKAKYGCSGRLIINPESKRAISYKDHIHEPTEEHSESCKSICFNVEKDQDTMLVKR